MQMEQLGARPDLLSTVAGWIYDEWWAPINWGNIGELTDLLRGHLVLDRIPLTLVALLECQPIGMASLVAHDVSTEQWSDLSPWLAAVYVTREHRCRGIGSTIVNAAVAKAAEIGVGPIYLLTGDQERFYAKLGWRALHRTDEDIVMTRNSA